jgi:hypothetical protein
MSVDVRTTIHNRMTAPPISNARLIFMVERHGARALDAGGHSALPGLSACGHQPRKSTGRNKRIRASPRRGVKGGAAIRVQRQSANDKRATGFPSGVDIRTAQQS